MAGFITIIVLWLVIRHLIKKSDAPKVDHTAFAKGRSRAQVDDARMRRFAQHVAREASKHTHGAKQDAKLNPNNAMDADYEEMQ